jgi:hypothetical protein
MNKELEGHDSPALDQSGEPPKYGMFRAKLSR